ncbi:hypothetical protein P7K49_015898 [Saguinus oedipus]|uniref:Family with sequence similarity 229 member A n=1 Tax=Saguinus oedipus TaxID=9490 RepID=A0ABQ9VAI5_SAGOE|nr:hypothetical protein P7K49_015898 [Saguinus oedipus]
MLPSSTPGPGVATDTCPAPLGPEHSPVARARAAAFSLGPALASSRALRGLDMSAQEPPQGRRFPIEAGDSRGLAAAPESQDSPEAVATEHNQIRSPHPRPDPRGTAGELPGWAGPLPKRPLSRLAFPRPLRRCPGCHCLTLLHVPIDVYLAMGRSPRARAT